MQDGQRSGPRLGFIGGGQLAKMMGLAALELGCEIAVLERSPVAPALRMASSHILGNWDDPATAVRFAQTVDVVTLENEFVNAESLAAIEQAGRKIFPSSRSLELVQDKFVQKTTFARAGIPVPRFRSVDSHAAIETAAVELGWPLLLKARRNGYDGKGNVTLRSAGEIKSGWSALNGDAVGLYVEEFCPFEAELAVIITRGRDGGSARYPLVKSVQKNHICQEVHAPADLPEATTERALQIAQAAVDAIDGVGSFGIELFLLRDGTILLNEIAPRVHNTGHYTIEACECSQFENHVRAVLGWPLGSPRLIAPAVMVNLLGDRPASGKPSGVEAALKVPGTHLHLYGKLSSGVGRKMGHVTAVAHNLPGALENARRAASAICFNNPE